MKIFLPKTILKTSTVRISTKFELASELEELWFEFPLDSQPSTDSDPFVLALLLLAMQKKEEIYVEGTLSRNLLKGIERYQQVFHSWYPDRFSQIKILP